MDSKHHSHASVCVTLDSWIDYCYIHEKGQIFRSIIRIGVINRKPGLCGESWNGRDRRDCRDISLEIPESSRAPTAWSMGIHGAERSSHGHAGHQIQAAPSDLSMLRSDFPSGMIYSISEWGCVLRIAD
jgi:hypothetical protein